VRFASTQLQGSGPEGTYSSGNDSAVVVGSNGPPRGEDSQLEEEEEFLEIISGTHTPEIAAVTCTIMTVIYYRNIHKVCIEYIFVIQKEPIKIRPFVTSTQLLKCDDKNCCQLCTCILVGQKNLC